MKKMFLMLAVLLLATAAYAADVTLSCSADGDEVTVSYTASADVNIPRGLGLDISLSNAETITSVTMLDPNYWVYPGTIDINESGVIVYDGNGIGQQDDKAYPGTMYGIDSNGITIEMGSLHSPTAPDGPNAPDISSALFKFTVSGDCNVAIAGNAARGNVVLYSAVEADALYTGCTVTLGCPTCKGDITGDSLIRTNDLSALIGMLTAAGSPYIIPVTTPQEDCADITGDGLVRTNDLSAMIGMLTAAGSPYIIPCP